MVIMGFSVPGRVSRCRPAWGKCMMSIIRLVSTIELLVCQRLTPLVTMPIGRTGRTRGLRFVRIRPIEHNGGGGLMQPGRWNRISLQGFEGDRAKHPVEVGGKQGIEDVPQAVIMECGTC